MISDGSFGLFLFSFSSPTGTEKYSDPRGARSPRRISGGVCDSLMRSWQGYVALEIRRSGTEESPLSYKLYY